MHLANSQPDQSSVIDLHKIASDEVHRFTVPLRGEDGSINAFESLQVVRRLPGRRIVCRGLWQQQSVYAKLFFGQRARRDASRDLRGVQALIRAQIQTPPLLQVAAIAAGADDAQGEALVFAAIPDSINAEQAWQQYAEDDALRLALARTLVTTVANHHAAGLLQRDLYFKNFLLQGECVYTLDGDGIRQLSRIAGRHQSMNNLALLLSKLDIVEEELWLPQLLETYAQARGWRNAFDIEAMRGRVMRQRQRMMSAYADKKVLRQCTDVQVKKSATVFRAITRPYLTETLQHALTSPDGLLEGQNNRRLKSGNTCTVGLTEIDGRKVVIKRYNIKHFWHGLERACRTTRAAISWSNAHRLLLANIATAPPVALLEMRRGIFRRQAYFLAEYVHGPDAAEFFSDAGMDSDHKRVAAENLVRMLYKLYLLKISHGDFKASNIKIADGRPVLIDLDSMRMHRYKRLFQRKHVRDLRRFMRNWQHDVATRSLLAAAFFKIYKNKDLLEKAGIVTR